MEALIRRNANCARQGAGRRLKKNRKDVFADLALLIADGARSCRQSVGRAAN